MWYNCYSPKVILADQVKGLISAMEADKEARREKGKAIILQFCKWHAVSNIIIRVKKTGKYNEEKIKEFTNMI